MFRLFRRRSLATTAERLRTRTARVVGEYLRLPDDQLEARLGRDFPTSLHIDSLAMSFKFADDPEFRYEIDLGGIGGTVADRFLSVFGEEEYLGFMISASDDTPWNCSATGGLEYRETGSARLLAKTFESALGIRDISQFMR